MAKVIYEFNESEDSFDINVIANRHKLLYALDQVKTLKRQLEKDRLNGIISVKDNKVVTEQEWIDSNYSISGTKSYIYIEEMIDRLDSCLTNVYEIMEEY